MLVTYETGQLDVVHRSSATGTLHLFTLLVTFNRRRVQGFLFENFTDREGQIKSTNLETDKVLKEHQVSVILVNASKVGSFPTLSFDKFLSGI